MDLSKYTLKELLLAAIKSEKDSYEIYNKLSEYVKNGLMKDKFTFLANEEKKHRQFIESLYRSECSTNTITLPEKSLVPLPEIIIPDDENISISDILKQAMDAEKAASEFYISFSKRFDEKDIQHMLHYFSDMELGHFKLLEQEKQSVEWFEQADVYWPMMHVGP